MWFIGFIELDLGFWVSGFSVYAVWGSGCVGLILWGYNFPTMEHKMQKKMNPVMNTVVMEVIGLFPSGWYRVYVLISYPNHGESNGKGDGKGYGYWDYVGVSGLRPYVRDSINKETSI